MQRKLFLRGPSGCGKSTLIRSVLGERLAEAGGFLTQPYRGEDGALLGMELLPAAAVAPVEGFLGARYLDFSTCPPSRDNEVFRTEAVRLLTEAAYYPFSMLDEIGGFELVIPQFREALGVFLSSSSPCIGVVKTLEEAELMRSYLGLGERFSTLAQRLHAALEADSDTLVIDVSEQDMGPAEQAVREWAKVYAG